LFQDGYDQLPQHARYLDAVGLILILSVVALLIAPALYHRTIARGEDTGQLHLIVSGMATVALLPFALSLGIALFIGMERVAGLWAGITAGVGSSVLALFCWYGWELSRLSTTGFKERQMAAHDRGKVEKTPLHSKIDQMLTEARVILPGAQALLGFQLAIVVTQGFERLPGSSKAVHAMGLGLIAITVILLMTPAAYHRIVYAGEDAIEFHRIGSIMVTAATLPLAAALSADVYVAITKIAESAKIGTVVACLVLASFVILWHVYPTLRRTTTTSLST
jgi:hypothetical protein